MAREHSTPELQVFTATFNMFSTRLAFLFVIFTAFVNAVLAVERVPVKRDDNLPARVPYVFPPPGTDAVSYIFGQAIGRVC